MLSSSDHQQFLAWPAYKHRILVYVINKPYIFEECNIHRGKFLKMWWRHALGWNMSCRSFKKKRYNHVLLNQFFKILPANLCVSKTEPPLQHYYIHFYICGKPELKYRYLWQTLVKVREYRLCKVRNIPWNWPFLLKTIWTSCHINVIQRLLNLKVESEGFVQAVRKHTTKIFDCWVSFLGRQIPTFCVGKVWSKFPSFALKLMRGSCFKNVRSRKYRYLCWNVGSSKVN